MQRILEVRSRFRNSTEGRYQYSSLPSDGSIRLLVLEPGTKREQIRCRLKVAKLDDRPKYEALSYVWGDSSDAEDVVCDGKLLSVPATLKIALERFRRTVLKRVLWADAICINQRNDTERSQQVTLMGLIYNRAVCVLAWLGKDDGHAKRAFAVISTAQSKMPKAGDGSNILKALTFTGPDDPVLGDATSRKSLLKFFACPYFTRAWTQQEAGLAKKCLVYWGPCQFLLDKMVGVVWWTIINGESQGIAWDLADPFIRFLILFAHTTRIGDSPQLPTPVHGLMYSRFWEVLIEATELQASDPRDKVYALLTHPSTRREHGKTIIEADYTKSVHEVYMQVSIAGLISDKDFLVLAAVKHLNSEALEVENYSLPSWVPDLSISHSRQAGMGILSSYRAGEDTEISVTLSETGREIHIRGIHFDEVNGCTDCFQESHWRFPSLLMHSTETSPLAQFVQVAQHKVANFPYPNLSIDALISIILTLGSSELTGLESDDLACYYYTCMKLGIDTSSTRGGLTNEQVSEYSHRGEYLTHNFWSSCGRKGFQTAKGYLGLGPKTMKCGDILCILFGADVPFILRPKDDYYLLVGACYVHGIMKGEGIDEWRDGKLEEQVFEIH